MKQTLPLAMLVAIVLSQSILAATGTWTPLTNVNSNNGNALLLTDGTVMMNREQGTAWNRLTPDASGSYINGTWSPLASMHDSRGLFASAVLNDGRVFVAGGEYGNGGSSVEIYDPVANTWSYVASWTGGKIADSTAKVLADGRVLLFNGSNNFCWIYNPANDTWTKTKSKLFLDSNGEESVVLLPDGSFLNVDNSSGNSQRYFPALDQWLDAGNPGPLTSNGGSPTLVPEIGPGLLLYDGRAFYLGATSNTAFYTPGINSWAAGPTIPNGLECGDKPSAVLPNGHVLVGAGNNGISVPVTTAVYEYDPVANNFVDTVEPSSCGFFLVLPTGQVLAATTGGNFIYTPTTGGSNSAWRPTVSAIAHNADGSYSIYGTQLNGLTEGAAFGDDAQSATNYPVIQLVSGANVVSYAKSYNFSTMGVATGGTVVGARFTTAIPANGTYSLSVIANGVASNPVPFGVFGAVPPPAITSALTATVLDNQPFSYLVTASNGADPASFTVTGLPAGLSAVGPLISGTPTVAGTFNVTLSATNAGGTGSATLVLTVVPSPVINSALIAGGGVGIPFSYTITANNGPTSFNAWRLPAGLTLNAATGVISGTPTAAGTSYVAIAASNAAGTGTATLVLTVYVPPVLTCALTASGTVGKFFNYTITASNSPTSFNATGLPPGLAFLLVANGPQGWINRTPTTAGTYNVTISASNAAGTATATVVLTINAAVAGAPVISSPNGASGTLGTAFSYTIAASNTPTSFNATGLPAGLSINTATGLISGTPTVLGIYDVAISATNASGTDTENLNLTVNPVSLPLSITTTSPLFAGDVGIPYYQPFDAVGFANPLSWSLWMVSSGTLPAGLTLSPDGVLSGIPTTAGTSNFTILFADWLNNSVSKAFTLTVNPTPVPPSITTQPTNVTVTAGANASFSVVATGTAPLTYQWKKNNVAIAGATSASYVTPATTVADSGSPFSVVVTNAAGSATSNNATLTVNPAAVPPSITTQPANVTVTAGATATFTVVATGTAPLTYQWKRNNVAIAGATSASYVTPATTVADSGSPFSVVVTNAAGNATSNNATLTVNPAAVPPSITTQPANVTVTAGATATFTVVATGTAPLTYQWKRNNVAIAGATSASYVTPATTVADSGSPFSVVVTNAAGNATSNNATLTVNAPVDSPPAITSAATATPNPATAGQSVTLTVAASDPDRDPLTCAWTFGDGANGSGSSATHVYASAGTYTASVTITDGKGGSVASSVSVVVNPNLGSGLVAYWKLDDASGTTASDSSGNGNNGTLVNGPVWTTGKVGGALRFDGVNDHVDVASVNHNVGTGDFTWTTWTYPQRLSNLWEGLMANGEYSPALYSKLYTAGQWGIYWGGDKPSGNTLTTGRWYHLAVIRQGGVIKFYQDGVQTSQTYPVATSMANGPLHLGTSGVAAGARYGQADLDDVHFYNRALSASEIATLAGAPPASQSIMTQPADAIAMTLSKVQGAVKFMGSGHDMATISGVIPSVPAGFDPTGKQLTLSIDGAAATFTLDGKGHGKSAQGIVSLRLKPSKRNPSAKEVEFLGGNVAFTAKIMNGTWAAVWNLDPTRNCKNVSMTVSTTLILGDAVYDSTVDVMYSSKAGVGGKFAK